jgi:hypothetical protein
LRNIFEKTTDKIMGLSRLARWHEKVNQSGFKDQEQNLGRSFAKMNIFAKLTLRYDFYKPFKIYAS